MRRRHYRLGNPLVIGWKAAWETLSIHWRNHGTNTPMLAYVLLFINMVPMLTIMTWREHRRLRREWKRIQRRLTDASRKIGERV